MAPLVVGITGGIGSGKSIVCEDFRELGVTVVDADVIAREIVAAGQPALAEIVARFGPAIIDATGNLRRAELRRIVFNDSAARRDLECIIHPRVHARIDQAIADCWAPYIVVCIPLLLETESYRSVVQRIVIVDCDPATQRARVMQRDKLTAAEVDAIIRTQVARGDRLQRADTVINNDGDRDAVRPQVLALHNEFMRLAGS